MNGAPRLKELSMSLATDSGEGFHELLQSQQELLEYLSESLENLTLRLRNYDFLYGNEPRLELPAMKNLIRLTLRSEGSGVGNYSIVPIEPEQIPKLRTLLIDPVMINDGIVFAKRTFISIEEVNLASWPPERRLNYDAAVIVQMCPNVKKLKKDSNLVPFDLKYLVQKGPNLEYLEFNIVEIRGYREDKFNFLASGFPFEIEWVLYQLAEHIEINQLMNWIRPPKVDPSLRDLRSKFERCLRRPSRDSA